MAITVGSFWLTILSLCCLLHCSAAGHDRKRPLPPSAMVVGTVVCDTCFRQDLSKSGHFISGASVAVECGDAAAARPGFRKEAKTNRRGVFRVRLPPEVGSHVEAIRSCSVKLVKSSEPFCAVASSAASSGLRLRSRRNGVRVFSAGFFTFKPLRQPELCYQKPELAGSAGSGSLADRKFNQPAFFFPSPPIPFLPSPPNVGGVPLPNNPFLPPPSVLPPIPLLPSPPPFINLPPIPLLAPPPPPPAFHLPPFLFPPNPLFPGIPPASTSEGGSP